MACRFYEMFAKRKRRTKTRKTKKLQCKQKFFPFFSSLPQSSEIFSEGGVACFSREFLSNLALHIKIPMLAKNLVKT